MKFVNKLILFFLILTITPLAWGQNNSEKLKKEQERLEKNISNTKTLLDKTKASSEASLNELKIIENQVQYREQLLNNFDKQIRGAELKIEEKDQQIIELSQKLEKLKAQYKKLLIYAYKHRSNSGKLMYLFSADSYYEAIKRNLYLKKIAEIQQKQKQLILQHQGLISKEKKSLETEKERKKRIADSKRIEKEAILKDKVKQQSSLQKLQQEEQKLRSKLSEDEKKKAVLKVKISEAIEREVAAAEKARKEKERKERLAKEKKEAEERKRKEADKTTPIATKPVVVEVKKEVSFEDKKELELNKSFESNKGRLPWPVEKGSITESYGKHAHPTLPNVTTNNNGVDISAPKNAQVRSVFMGEVTSVFNIPGAGKVVIIKHGNYRTVYSNLQEVYVSIGAKVTTKQAIGALLALDNENISVAHFEIHQVIGDQVQRVNPSLWISN